jgi:hypothetical protein
LLATAFYLALPAIASQAISLIHHQYLNFACGKPVLRTYHTDDHAHAAVGLEHLAEMLEDVETPTISTTHQQSAKQQQA